MDRKAWIVVTLCILGLVGNYYWMAKQQQAADIAAANAALVAEANGEVAPLAGGDSIALGVASGAPLLAGEDGSAVVPSPAVDAVTEVVTREGVSFTYSSLGGISEVVLLEHFENPEESEDGGDSDEATANVVLNRGNPMPIGAIGFGKDVPPAVPHQIQVSGDEVILTATLAGGLEVVKTFIMREDGEEKGEDRHHVDCLIKFVNRGEAPVDLSDYTMYAGASVPMVGETAADVPPSIIWDDRGDAESKSAKWFDGMRMLGVQFTQPRAAVDVLAPDLRWAGVSNKFYVTVIAPALDVPAEAEVWGLRFETEASKVNPDPGKRIEYGVHGGLSFPKIDLPPSQEVTLEYDFYIGPKEYRRVNSLEQDLGGVMFYGFFSPISSFLMWVMSWFHGFVGNWGWAIVLMTLLIRVCIWPLHAKSTRAMKRMSLLAPKMSEIKEKHADDPQRMNTEMMGLYKKYKVNPVAGCLPIFLQMPIFFGFFSLLRSTAELRGADWMWVNDLSMPDTVAHIAGLPINPLPIVMGLSMFVQMSLAPKSGDSTQQMVFKFMPLIFLFICYSFASALALYWTVSNLFSIGQTYFMRFQPDPVLDEAASSSSKGKGKGGKGGQSSGSGGAGGSGDGSSSSSAKSRSGPRTGGGKTKSRGNK